MKPIFRKIILAFIFMLPFMAFSQEAMVKAEKEKAPASSRAQRKKAKQKWKEQRKGEMDQRKAVKEHHKKLQDKATRKRMKKEKKKAERLRANKKESGFVRWLKYR